MTTNCLVKPASSASEHRPVASSGAIPLFMLQAGQKARIAAVVGQDDEVLRLYEFGLRLGATVEMLRPGFTSIIRLGAAKVAFRAKPGLSVLVIPESQQSAVNEPVVHPGNSV